MNKVSALAVRAAEDRDLPQLTAIYNHYVATTAVTFDIDELTVELRREWYSHYAPTGPYRLLVAVEDGDTVLGYAASSPFRPRAGYRTTVETSVYCRRDAVGRGLGTRLYARLFAELAGQDLHRAVAGVALPNAASVRLHERAGFAVVGTFSEVGRKHGRYWDVLWLQKEL